MKSRTLFCKLTPFKKDITRFAPVWILYVIGMVMVLFSNMSYREPDRAARSFAEIFGGFSVVNLIYAAVVAGLLFGDLFNSRMCYSLHALPQRRETWFISHAAAGFCFSLIPNLITSLLLMTLLGEAWFVSLYWLLVMELQFLFYFGTAILSIMLTGNRIGALAVDAVLNFFSMLAYGFATVIYKPQMPGVVINFDIFSKLSPTVHMCQFDEYLVFQAKELMTQHGYYDTKYIYAGLGQGWGYTVLLAVIGLALMGLAVMVYRRRDLECAGDFVAFRKMAPVACVVLTLCVGLVCAFMGEIMSSSYALWLPVGIVVGYFGSLMLLERRVKVFRGKTFAGLGVIFAVLVVSLLVICTDALGIVSWLPKANQVKSVTISNYLSDGYSYEYYYGNRISVTLTEESEIEDIIDAHEDILDRMDEHRQSLHYVVLEYTLVSGRTVKRAYYAPAYGTNYEIISRYFYTPEQILGYTDWEEYKANVSYIWMDKGDVPAALYGKVVEALKADCMAGYVTTNGNDDVAYWVDLEVAYPDGTYVRRNLAVKTGAENTIALMNTPELILGYTDWEEYLDSVRYVYIDGEQISDDLVDGLLKAMRQDCEEGTMNTDGHIGSTCYVTVEAYFPDGNYLYREIWIPVTAESTQNYLAEHFG